MGGWWHNNPVPERMCERPYAFSPHGILISSSSIHMVMQQDLGEWTDKRQKKKSRRIQDGQGTYMYLGSYKSKQANRIYKPRPKTEQKSRVGIHYKQYKTNTQRQKRLMLILKMNMVERGTYVAKGIVVSMHKKNTPKQMRSSQGCYPWPTVEQKQKGAG